MTNSNEWKSKLIASSLPLEYEIAQILVSKEFHANADFKYSRIDSNDLKNEKDFSIDLDAVLVFDLINKGQGSTHLELLIECKQKKSDSKWLFLPDPNPYPMSEISTRGSVFHFVDEFSRFFFPIESQNEVYSFFEKIPVCYKGMEVNCANGNVFDTEIKHGISQLQYALPRFMNRTIFHCINDSTKKSFPYLFMYCPILVTTADLYIANENMKTIDIENADSLDQIAEKVPYLIFSSDFGPEFESHCSRESTNLTKLRLSASFQELDQIRSQQGGFEYRSPITIAHDLFYADTIRLQEYFTQFIVCSKEYFPSLLDEIVKKSQKAINKISDHNKIGLKIKRQRENKKLNKSKKLS